MANRLHTPSIRRRLIFVVALWIAGALPGCGGDDDDVTPGDDDATSPTSSPTPTPMPSPTPSIAQICGWDGIAGTPGPFDAWWQDGVFYEVFVRSFQDSGTGSSVDGIGDLQGIISRLDYLNDGDPGTDTDLGITGIWLMPVFPSPSEHGYDTIDYYGVNPDYGTLADLEALVAQAHARGISVILDLAFNHTSDQHPWFQDSRSAEDAAHRRWYVWSSEAPNAKWHAYGDAYYYAAFYSTLPDLNYYTAEVQTEMGTIYDYWMDLGLDGFRLDGVKYLVEQGSTTEHTEGTHCYLQGQRRYFATHWPDRLLVGEIYDTTLNVAPYFGDGTDELPLAFDFSVSEGIIDSINASNNESLHRGLANKNFYYPDPAMGAPFLRNHDMDRTGSVLPDDAARKQAAAILLSTAGTPFLYYGEEIGMTGVRDPEDQHDNDRRTPMQWTDQAGAGFTTGTPWYPVNEDYVTLNVAAQLHTQDSLLRWYQKLIRLRLADDALRHGEWTRVPSTPTVTTYAYLRGSGPGAVLVVLNLASTSSDAITVDLSAVGSWFAGQDLLSGEATAGPIEGVYAVGSLPAYGVQWIKLQSEADLQERALRATPDRVGR